MIQPDPVGLQGSVAMGIREVPSSKLPWNWLGVTMRSPWAVEGGLRRSMNQPDLPTLSLAVATVTVLAASVVDVASCWAVMLRGTSALATPAVRLPLHEASFVVSVV